MTAFLDHSLREAMSAPWMHIVLALASALCGGIVGLEREKREKPAGLRTLVLVCLGSTTFTMASYAFSTTTGDSGRVAAQIVTGIGFLGAGTILHASGFVTGMTTAATIWVVAAIGMVVGNGYAVAGLGLSVFVRVLLTGIYHWETGHTRSAPAGVVRLVIDPAHGKTRIRIERAMELHRVHSAKFTPVSGHDERQRQEVTISFTLSHRVRCDFLYALAGIPEVLEITSEELVRSAAGE